MAQIVPTNTDLSTAVEAPGAYAKIVQAGAGSNSGDLDRRVLFVGARGASGTGALNSPVRVVGRAQAIGAAGSAGTDIVRAYDAMVSRAGSATADTYFLMCNEPAGTNATRLITIAGPATSSGSIEAIICGYSASCQIQSGDTATTIGANLLAQIKQLPNVPVDMSASTATAGAIVLQYLQKGITGLDFPIIVNLIGAAGVTASPGTVQITHASTGDGAISVNVGAQTIPTTFTGVNAVGVIAASVNANINAGGYPVTSTVATDTVTLYYVPGRVVNLIQVPTPTGGVTAAVTVGTQPDPTSSTERPVLTTALANMAAQVNAYRLWVSVYSHATPIGALATHIEAQFNGLVQKDQFLHFGSTSALTVAGAIPTTSSPNLTTLQRYNLAFCPDSPQQGYEHAARDAGCVIGQDYYPHNYDGETLTADPSQTIPLMLPHPAVRLSTTDRELAMHTYGMTPHIVDETTNTLLVQKGRTTWVGPDDGSRDWGMQQHLSFIRVRMRFVGGNAIKGRNIRKTGTPHTANVVTLDTIRNALIGEAFRLDGLDLFDGAKQWAATFQLGFNPSVPSRADAFVPAALVRPIHQFGLVVAPV